MVKRGQVVAEWRPSSALCVITTASGEVLKQPVYSADMDVRDSASTSVSLVSAPDSGITTAADLRLLVATVGGENLSETDN
jgi:hypothetical protein